MITGYWILGGPDGHTPIKVSDAIQWARAFEQENRVVQQDDVGTLFVSTVFLGIDHRFGGEGPPLLFETMIFGEPEPKELFGKVCEIRPDLDMYRYSTWAEAEQGHKVALELARLINSNAKATVESVLAAYTAGSKK